MNKKEISEIRKHTSATKSNSTKIFGCYFSNSGEVISRFKMPTGLMDENEKEQYFSIFQKVLSNKLDSKAFDVSMSTKFITESPVHELLMNLLKSEAADEDIRDRFFDLLIKSCADTEKDVNFLCLLSYEAYDVPNLKDNGEDSETVFKYIVCAICPVKQSKEELSYVTDSKDFHNKCNGYVSKSPLAGFMFPAFTGRTADIGGALVYAPKMAYLQTNIFTGIFGCEAPDGQAVERQNFASALRTAMGEECALDTVQSLQDALLDMEVEHERSENNGEELTLSKDELVRVLEDRCGFDSEQSENFESAFEESFGKDYKIAPGNIMELSKCILETPSVKITTSQADCTTNIKMKEIDGVKYVLIRANEGVTMNGIPIDHIPTASELS